MALKNVAEMAAVLRIGRRTLLEWVRSKKVPVIRVGKRVLRFDEEEVLKALKKAK